MNNPALLPDALDATPAYGLVRTLLFFGLYVLLVVGLVAYLMRRLPHRWDPLDGEDEDDEGLDEAL